VGESSVDPSSTAINSQSVNVCDWILRMASTRYFDEL